MAMVSPNTHNPDEEHATLHAIVSLMSDLMSYTSNVIGSQQHEQLSVRNEKPRIDIPELNLPYPHATLAPFFKIQMPEEVRQQILQVIENRINKLRQQYLDAYRRACLASVQKTVFISDLKIVHDAYLALYVRNSTPMVERTVSFLLHEIEKYQKPRPLEVKPTFNIEYTPVLEKYFESNAYPSIAHRTSLAQKSGMTPRQIEVWFQNHRNRAKKEGKVVPRLDTDFPLKQALQIVHQPISIFQGRSPTHRLPTPPMDERKHRTMDSKVPSQQHPLSHLHPSLTLNITPSTLLDDSCDIRPPHAFPATKDSRYPDPFPNDDGVFKFAPPVWRRGPTTTLTVLAEVDMDDFARTFHLKLNFAEHSRRRATTPSNHEYFSQPWFSATTTFAPSAPHPALIHKTLVSQTTSVSTPHLETFTFQPKFGLSSFSTLPAPSLASPGETSARKSRPLPQRRPPQSRSRSFGSRTSSFSSDSSVSSYPSPEISTPPPLPQLDLPVFHEDGQAEHSSQQLFNFSHAKLDIHYPLSPPAGSSLLNPELSKLSDSSSFDNPYLNFGHDLGQIFT